MKRTFSLLPSTSCFLCVLLIVASLGASAWAQRVAAPQLIAPNGLTLNAQGELFISDIGAHCIFKRTRQGRLLRVAGTGVAGFSGDGGAATQAQLHAPHDLLCDAAGNLLIADTGNQRIRQIDARGIITTIAGDGKALQSNYNGAVPATSLNNPQSLALLTAAGDVLIADTYNHVVRKLTRATGTLSIFAGSVAGFGGDGGNALQAQMSLPMAVAVAPDGSVFISDAGNSRIRQVTPDGKIKTIGGVGPPADTYGGGYAGDGGAASKAKLFSATDLKCAADGTLYVMDSGNHRLRVIRNGVITTLAGNGEAGFAGDGGLATRAQLNTPQKLALQQDGNLIISDRSNRALRVVARDGNIRTLLRDQR